MYIKELTNLQEKEQSIMGWTVRVRPKGDSFGGIAFRSNEEKIFADGNTEEEVLANLKKEIQSYLSSNSSKIKPNIDVDRVTQTKGLFNVATTNDIFDGHLPGLARIVSEGAVYIDFIPLSKYEDEPELAQIYKLDGFIKISPRNLKKGTEAYQLSLSPGQVQKHGLEFSGIYGLDEINSTDPDYQRFKLSPEPIDYSEPKLKKVFNYPTFHVATWTKGQPVTEARDPKGDYEEKLAKGEIDRVIKTIEGNQSGAFTKMAQEYRDLDNLMEAYTKARDSWNDTMKGHIEESFDPADKAYTRVIETVSMTITMSKEVETKDKDITDWEQVAQGLLEAVPELKDHFEKLTGAFTKTIAGKTRIGSLGKPKFKEPVKESILDFAKSFFGKVMDYVGQWASHYDKKLAKIKALMPQAITEGKILNEESVLSSWIEDLTWDDPNVTMTLNNGRDYMIHNVPYGVFEEWLASSSKGRFWHGYVRGDYMVT